ncbi:MAG: 30S ribosomal protein S16 [Coriobacteriia bacterium]|nr:30S ribosomal protein S16 [Coriobacteriia bacterium]
MSVKIRLARHGAKKAPYYRVVVADARAKRDGRCIEEVGRYNPCVDPALITFDMDKVDTWIKQGAQPTETVARLLKIAREQA